MCVCVFFIHLHSHIRLSDAQQCWSACLAAPCVLWPFRSSANCLINRCLIAISRARLASQPITPQIPHQTANNCAVSGELCVCVCSRGTQFTPCSAFKWISHYTHLCVKRGLARWKSLPFKVVILQSKGNTL